MRVLAPADEMVLILVLLDDALRVGSQAHMYEEALS